VTTAPTALNGLFDPKDYPAPGRIAEKFAVRRHFLPVAQADDFRVHLGDAQVARIRAEIEARNAELLANATSELFQRVQAVTSRLVERLSAFEVDPMTGTRLHPFRDKEHRISLWRTDPRWPVAVPRSIGDCRRGKPGRARMWSYSWTAGVRSAEPMI
jgi:hypothetical protein